jgi:hypothetical protein
MMELSPYEFSLDEVALLGALQGSSPKMPLRSVTRPRPKLDPRNLLASLDWRHTRGGLCANELPKKPGVYVYGLINRLGMFQVSADWVYVGRSLGNLRRRVQYGHDPHREINESLRAWMRRHAGRYELWFAVVDTDCVLDVERALIKAIEPRFNTQHNTNQRNDKRNPR